MFEKQEERAKWEVKMRCRGKRRTRKERNREVIYFWISQATQH